MQRSYVVLGVAFLLLDVSITRHFPTMVVTLRFYYSPFPDHGRYSTFQILGLSDLRLNPSLNVSITRRFMAVVQVCSV